MATEVESSGVPVSASAATPTGSEEQTAVWPLDYPVSVGLLERRIAEAISDVTGSGDLATKSYVESSVSAAASSLATAVAAVEDSLPLVVGTDVDDLETRVSAIVPKVDADDASKGAPRRIAVSKTDGAVTRRAALTPSCLDVRATATVNGQSVSTVTRYGELGIEYGSAVSPGLTTHALKVPSISKDEVIATESGLALKVDKTSVGSATVVDKETGAVKTQGVASLDENGHVPSSQLPSYVDDVLEFATKNDFPGAKEGDDAKGETGKIYVALDTNLTYRWGGTAYVEITSSLALGETSATAYAGDKGKSLKDAFDRHVNTESTVNPHKVTAAQVGVTLTNGTLKVGDQSITPLTAKTETDPKFSEWKGGTSIAAGEGSTASGENASAFGYDNTASGYFSSALGNDNTASDPYSFALGTGNTASGESSSALGIGNTAEGMNSTALGYKAFTSNAWENALAVSQTPDKIYLGSSVDDRGESAKTLQSYLDEIADTTELSSEITRGKGDLAVYMKKLKFVPAATMFRGELYWTNSNQNDPDDPNNQYVLTSEDGYTFTGKCPPFASSQAYVGSNNDITFHVSYGADGRVNSISCESTMHRVSPDYWPEEHQVDPEDLGAGTYLGDPREFAAEVNKYADGGSVAMPWSVQIETIEPDGGDYTFIQDYGAVSYYAVYVDDYIPGSDTLAKTSEVDAVSKSIPTISATDATFSSAVLATTTTVDEDDAVKLYELAGVATADRPEVKLSALLNALVKAVVALKPAQNAAELASAANYDADAEGADFTGLAAALGVAVADDTTAGDLVAASR